MDYFIKGVKNYVGFSGKASRKEYWMYVLFYIIFAVAACVIDNILGTARQGVGFGTIYMLYALALFLPTLAITVRRLHDIKKSGWMVLVSLIPLIGWIWLLILLVTKGGKK